jgi:hypothetical protein
MHNFLLCIIKRGFKIVYENMEENQECSRMDFGMNFKIGYAFQYFSSHSFAEVGMEIEAGCLLGLKVIDSD